MDLKTAVKQIKAGEVSPLYLCHGTEKYRMQEFVNMLENELIAEDQRAFAVAHYDLAETPVELVVEEAETAPFLAERKLIVVRDSALFTAGKESSKIEHRVETLLEYLKNPADYSVLVFLAFAEKLDERKKLVKTFKSSASVISFMPMSGDELAGWVAKQFKKSGASISSDAVELLLKRAGASLAGLSAEIEKLSLFAGSGGTVSPPDVEKLVAIGTEQSVFVLVEHIAGLKLQPAMNIFYDLLKQREEPIKIVSLIARQFRIMLQVKEMSDQNYSQQQMAGQLGLHPYAVKIAAEQARRFEAARLRRILSSIARLDHEIKTGAVDKVFGLEMFLLRLGA
ncbi:DNA polymerase III subunit delta [Saccharibacillus sp. CPCC 101409]|uniref:DNA polymerase III subunit delta n=1 Tax=Saccharibacillus sp. CPCC 101409 TaxID=3058041 RepID=UPI0026735913|nr:DNA polymerase III subunit delta [Saccharibacillus sp. CPCC 101409]MDO3409141.1 DNA polymerase III subunit delta [Saccharibacillus sp. CPCC 101409]